MDLLVHQRMLNVSGRILGRNVIIRSAVIPDLGVELRVTLAQPIREASGDILAECVGTSASRYDVHAPDRASKPPGPDRR
jgi:hypothetical protein